MATIAQIIEMLDTASKSEFEAIERSLAGDTRKGIAAALKTARARFEREEREEQRLRKLFEFDRSLLDERLAATSDTATLKSDDSPESKPSSKEAYVVGLDEVGRGAVAGPLAVGAVVFPAGAHVPLLNDSKQLTPDQREIVARDVIAQALAWSVFFVEPGDIDRDGMSASLRRAFSGALGEIEHQGIHPSIVLIDGNPLGIDDREVNVVKGDAKSASIAAASVVAKVVRDDYMRSLSSTYPHYAFHENKGYASEEHRNAIREYGISPVHRASFCKGFLQETLF